MLVKHFAVDIKIESVQQKLLLKDCSMSFLISQRPKIKNILDQINPIIHLKKHQYKFISFDYQELYAVKGSLKTCRDLSWHTDSQDNEYLIIAWGNKRTLFKTEISQLELDSGTLYQYDSSDIHCGQILNEGEKRVFLRICFSNHLRPKNKILFDF